MRVLFAAGGTGGHIYPALALARHLRDTGQAQALFVGTERGMERELIPAAGFPLAYIPVVGLQRRLSLQAGRAVLLAGRGVLAARRLITSFRPDVVVGTGGYVAGPVVLAGVLSGVPAVIHEQNALPGFTNVLLSRLVARTCISFAGSEKYFPARARITLTGNPRASEAALACIGDDAGLPALLPGVPMVLCVGGSHGAARLNEVFAASIEQLLKGSDTQVVYITGPRYFAELEKKLAPLLSRFPRRLVVLPYHPVLPRLLARAAVVVSRAGATTLAEITALGVPALLIPSPNVTNNHQEYNARLLFDRGGALLVREAELDAPGLAARLLELLADRDRLRQMSAAVRSLGIPDAAERMAGVLYQVAGNKQS